MITSNHESAHFHFGVWATVVLLIFGKTGHGHVNFTSSNLPIVIIDTHGQPIPNEPKIDADMGSFSTAGVTGIF